MPDAFFQKKRKRSSSGPQGDNGNKRERSRVNDPSSSSSSSGRVARGSARRNEGRTSAGPSRRNGGVQDEDEDDEFDVDTADTRHRYEDDLESEDERDAEETPAEARVRMAKMYLEGLKESGIDPEDADAALADQENIASRLQKDLSEHSGRLHIFIASRISSPEPAGTSTLFLSGGHRGPLTAVVAAPNGQYIYTAGKDGNVFRWRMSDGRIDLLMPSRRRATGKRNGKQRERKESATISEMDEDEEDEEVNPASSSNVIMNGQASSSIPRSRTSGSSRRRARQIGAALAGKSKTSKTGTSTTLPSSSANHEVVDLVQDEGHTDEVWSLAISSDGKIVVSGGVDRRIGVWSITSPSTDTASTPSAQWVKALTGHKDSISGLKFRVGSHELYSASLDRTVKLFDVDQLSYIETLFGHQESITSLDALRGEFALTAGGRDRSARWWKVREESQLVFRGGAKSKMRDAIEGGDLLGGGEGEDGRKIRGDRGGAIIEGSLECVAMIDDGHFLTGGDSGTISLWSLGKKKPNYSRAATHGFESTPRSSHTAELVAVQAPSSSSSSSAAGEEILTPRWITSLATLPYSDLFASGSWDGSIRLWQLDPRLRSFRPISQIHVPGFVNGLQIFQPPRASLLPGKEVLKKEEWRWRVGRRGVYRFADRGGAEDGEVRDGREDSEAATGMGKTNGIHLPQLSSNGGVGSAGGVGVVGASASTSGGKKKEDVPPILLAAIGSEPRTGRWMKLRGRKALNGAIVVPLSLFSKRGD